MTIRFKVVENKILKQNTLRVKSGHIEAQVDVLNFIDADTKQHIVYIPSLEISGYGTTLKQATETAQFSLKDLFQHLLSLPDKKREIELQSLGWQRNKLKDKEFSNFHVDGEGNLNGFNIAEGKVEHMTLEAA